MDDGRLDKIESLFDSALELSPAERPNYLNRVCADDQNLKEEVLALLKSYDEAEDFIEASAVEDIFPQVHIAHKKFTGGDILGHYRITREIGRGGMGEVYLAEDVRLGRQIALKILPVYFTEDLEQVGRFEQEARAASSLNHPNIITIHDIAQEGDTHFIATEFIQGQTLREKLATGTLDLNEALDIAMQIAKALMAAHAAGIIHRDIKPENIMVRDDGLVKVLDFGLAKPIERESSTNYGFPTHANDLKTNPETFVGTVGYLSPEQVLRAPVDHRTDIFSLGVVMYEMLSGERPFKGKSPADIGDAVLHGKVAPLRLEHPRFEPIVCRALEKDRDARYQTADDLFKDLKQLTEALNSQRQDASESDGPSAKPGVWKRQVALGLSALLFLAASVYLARQFNRQPDAAIQPAIIAAAQPLTQSQALEYYPSFSPDGQSIIFESFNGGTSDIYSQRIDDRAAINLTKDYPYHASQPACSPDGEHIAFSSAGIWIMSAKGSDYVKLTEEGFNPSWSPDSKEIVYATDRTIDSDRATIPSQLWIINLETRDKRLLTEGDATQPSWSPHGQRIAYWNTQRGGQRDIWTMATVGGNPIAVTDDEFEDWGPVWSPDGKYLYFISNRGGSMNLWRIAIEEETGKVSGQPEPVTTPAVFCWHICFSRDGKRIAYVQVSKKGNLNRLTFDPVNEKVLGEAVSITKGSSFATEPVVLSDGQSLVYNSIGDKQEDLFLLNLSNNKEAAEAENNLALRLTNDPFKDRSPQGSPDGQKIAFYSDRGGDYQVWLVNRDGSELKQLTYAKGGNVYCPVWSPDSSRIAYFYNAATVTNTFIIKANQSWGEQKPQPLPQNHPLIKHFLPSSWSSDGSKLAGWQHWTERGRVGVFVYSFASKSYERWTDFGSFPVWLSDNRRLLFFKDDKIYLVDEKTKKPKQIYQVDSIAWTDLSGFTLTKDDRQLYFSQVTTEADIWLADIR